MERFSITPLTGEIVTTKNGKEIEAGMKADLEKKYDGKITFESFTVVLPILHKT